VQALNGDAAVQEDAQPAANGAAADVQQPDKSMKAKRQNSPEREEATRAQKKQKSAGGSADIPKLVVNSLSKKGGTVKLQKLLAMVTKKLAKYDAAAADKDATLTRVRFS
jgi:hypothetical protein